MKRITYIFSCFRISLLVLPFVSLVSCKKGFDIPPPMASLRIANTIPDIPVLYTSFQGTVPLTYYASAVRLHNTVNNSTGNYMSRPSGDAKLALYRTADTLNPSLPFMQLTLSLLPNSYSTLFLTGTASQPDSLFVKEQFSRITDSVTGIRFINLSPGSETMTVNLLGHRDNPEVDDLPYKTHSAFILYPANANVVSYTFEIRDKRTGDLLTTYTTSDINSYKSTPAIKNAWLFYNSTLMITGLPGGTGASALKVELINHM